MGSILSSLFIIGSAAKETANLPQLQKPDIPWWFWVVMGAALVILLWMLFNHPKEDEEEGKERKVEPVILPELGEKSPAEEAFDFSNDEIEYEPLAEEQSAVEENALPSPFLNVYEEELEETPEDVVINFKVDDLTMIEGIGTKVSKLLAQADIQTFEQLANTDVEKLQVVLASAGIFLTDPTTWPVQARMAANGEWDELREYQNELKNR